MKRKIKFLSCLFCLLIGAILLSACSFDFSSLGSVDENVDPIPSEVTVEGFKTEVTVGEGYYSSLKVQQKLEGEWQEVVKADYAVSCDYDGSKYGEYAVVVYLVNYPHIKFETTLSVNPLTISLPSYTTVYNAQSVDIKSKLEEVSDGLYEVTKYTKETNVGEYSVSLTLTEPNKYCWINDEGELLKGATKSIGWSITKASAKTYSGESQLVVYYGDTLYDVAVQNNLKHISWIDGDSTLVTNQSRVSAIYNESPGNYEDTYISIFFTEIISTANYSVEYYLYDGSEYVLDTTRSYDSSATISELVNLIPDSIDGYVLNQYLSNTTGKVLKNDGLTLKLFYDLLN